MISQNSNSKKTALKFLLQVLTRFLPGGNWKHRSTSLAKEMSAHLTIGYSIADPSIVTKEDDPNYDSEVISQLQKQMKEV